MDKYMQIKFWGVRGAIPCPGPHTIKYGGNTSCLELRFNNLNRRIIIDAGSGIRELGNHLIARKDAREPIRAEIFITHTHWDHIQGFPFFAPIYMPGTRLKIYGPSILDNSSLEEAMAGQLAYRYFPIRPTELAAEIEYIDLKEGRFDLGDGITLTTQYLNHPLLCLGYRFEFCGRTICTAFDTEPFQNIFVTTPEDPAYDEFVAAEAEIAAREGNQRLQNFFSGADCLIHDTQYTQEEYERSKTGWGHTPFETAIHQGRKANVKRLILFHHEPVRTDAQIDELSRRYCHPEYTGPLQVSFAREGSWIVI